MNNKVWKALGLVLAILIIAAILYQLIRPLPVVVPVEQTPQPPKTTAIALPWAAAGQSALGAAGYGVLDSHNASSAVPIASTAKIITAIAVLQKKPLAVGEQGPMLTLDSTDVDYFNYYYKNDGSVVNVADGEQISEYQALQAMLLPSANNMGDTLARWAFGSPAAYVTYANTMVKGLGMSRTAVGNTNGFDDTTTSTADDMVRLGLTAMRQPVLAEIVGQSSAAIPVQGQIKNTNVLLGSNGIVGIKTGNTDKAGGCYLFASKQTVEGRQITLVGAVLGQSSLIGAMGSSRTLISAAVGGFQNVAVISQGQTLAAYTAPWGASAEAKSAKALSLLVWRGKDIEIVNNSVPLRPPLAAGAPAGSVVVNGSRQSASSPLNLSQELTGPSLWWRLTRK